MRKLAIGLLFAALAMAGLVPPARAQGIAGIGDYSYLKLERIDWGSSRYFGDSAQGNGVALAYQVNRSTFVYGSYDRLEFAHLPGYLYQTGIGIGYQQTRGKISAYLRIGYYRSMLSGPLGGARSYYWQTAYGVRAALNRYFSFVGEIYSDIKPDFGSRPWGIKAGVNFAMGPFALSVFADHNPDVNSLVGQIGIAF